MLAVWMRSQQRARGQTVLWRRESVEGLARNIGWEIVFLLECQGSLSCVWEPETVEPSWRSTTKLLQNSLYCRVFVSDWVFFFRCWCSYFCNSCVENKNFMFKSLKISRHLEMGTKLENLTKLTTVQLDYLDQFLAAQSANVLHPASIQ